MRLVAAHARMLTVELARYPAYTVPTLLFPAAFFLVFAAPASRPVATEEMASFAGFAAIGVAFFQFGVGIAAERASPWETYLRTLPVAPSTRLAARVISALPFAAAASAIVVGVALTTTDARLPGARLAGLAATLAVGTVPFALLGIALGYLSPQRGALPLANLLYLGLSYAGGLWMRPRDLPRWAAAVSPYLPTRTLRDALAASVAGHSLEPALVVRLAAFGLVFAALAAVGYRRDEGRRFR